MKKMNFYFIYLYSDKKKLRWRKKTQMEKKNSDGEKKLRWRKKTPMM